MNNELISIIIPTYNRATYIKESLLSVLNQTYTNIEVIVVDDASSDDTEAVVRGIKDSRIRYYKLEKNGGAGRARNKGVEFASGKIIAFHDSDDFCLAERIEKQYLYLCNNKKYGLVYSEILVQRGDDYCIFPPGYMQEKLEGDIHKYLLDCNTVDCPTMMMYRSLFEEVGGFNETYPNLEDWEFIIRISKICKIGFINEPLILSVLLDAGLSADRMKFYKTRARMIADTREFLEEEGIFNDVIKSFLEGAARENYLEISKLSLEKELLNSLLQV